PRGRRSRAPAADGALGYCLPPPAGLNKEEAASCRFTNVQSPGLRSGHATLDRPFKAGALSRLCRLVASRRFTQPESHLIRRVGKNP
ncbi:MAG TPA: hypothetical protein VMW38_00345, partial [Terriglobia bacterium]|nr:hypothetical protein [Terriglobia bacterium]